MSKSLVDMLKEKVKEASELEQKVERLNKEVLELKSEKEIGIKKTKDAEEKCELANNFKNSNYNSLVKELFEKPSKKATRISLIIFLFSIIASTLITLATSSYFDDRNSDNLKNGVNKLSKNMSEINRSLECIPSNINKVEATFDSKIEKLQEVLNDIKSETNDLKTRIKGVSKITSSLEVSLGKSIGSLDTKISVVDKKLSTATKISKLEKDRKIKIQKDSEEIIKYIKHDSVIKNYFPNYKGSENEFRLLYFMRLSDKSDYYEAFLEAFSDLEISSKFCPKTEYDMLLLDKEIFDIYFSVTIIAKIKHVNKLAFNSSDTYLKTYKSDKCKTDFGVWCFTVNSYSDLYSLSGRTLKATISRIQSNDRLGEIEIPRTITYMVKEDTDRKMIIDLSQLGSEINKSESRSGEKLIILLDRLEVKLNKKLIKKVQNKLFKLDLIKKFDIDGFYGEITKEAIKKYQKKKNIEQNGKISINLLSLFEIDLAPDEILETIEHIKVN